MRGFYLGGNPCCFVSGGILTVEFLDAVIRKDFARVKEVLLAGVIIIFSFFLYYLYWLKPVIDAGGMTAYWKDKKFPLLFFVSKENFVLAKNLIFSYLNYFKDCRTLAAIFCLLAMILSFVRRKKEIMAVSVMFVIMLIASSMGLFPVQDRIWLFFYPILIVLIVYLGSVVIKSGKAEGYLVILPLCMLIFYQGQGIVNYRNPDHVFRQNEEVNGLISYAEDHIKNERLYLYGNIVRLFQYKTGMDNHSIGEGENNVVYGEVDFANQANREDVEYLIENPNLYLMFGHTFNRRIFPLFKELTDHGYLYLVKRDYGTPLYYYSDAYMTDKVSAELTYIDSYEKEGLDIVKLQVKNTGDYYLGNGYNDLYIGTSDGRIKTVVSKQLNAGESCDVEVSLKRADREKELELGLYLEDQYAFSAFGASDIPLAYADGRWALR